MFKIKSKDKNKFDYIINDVAGISEDIAKVSDWYKNVSCLSGKDGTKLVNEILKKSNLNYIEASTLEDAANKAVKALGN